MHRLLRWLVPRQGLFRPQGPLGPGAPRGLAVFSYGENPSVDYYFRSRAGGAGAPPALFVDTRASLPESLAEGSLDGWLVVIVRHAPRDWLLRLLAEAPGLHGAAFFLDDDLPGAAQDPWLPALYALRTTLRLRSARGLLAPLCGQVWAASEELARRYPEAGALVLPPLAFAPPRPPQAHGQLTVFYHGTAAHVREKRWLREVAARVQASLPDSVFEISGGPEVEALYADIPRVRVVPQLSWPRFQARLSRQALHIGLAPLLDSSYNAARSHTKLLEISGCGAAGIYAAPGPYAAVVRHGETGLLADMEPGAWVDAVLRLAGDAKLRLRLAAGAQAWAAAQPRLWPWETA